MKTKPIVFILTLIVMIAITPLVFSKLMNSKFNEMLDNLKKQGFLIKEIKNKSTYLNTDRVFEVEIPINNSIEKIKAEIETKFKNLPVTDVKFLGKVLNIEFADKNLNILNDFIKDKIKFLVVTPNFKTYRYKIYPIEINLNNQIFKTKEVNGVYNYPESNKFSINSLLAKINTISLEVKNLTNEVEKKKNSIKSNTRFNAFLNINNIKTEIQNVNLSYLVIVSKKLKTFSQISIDKIYAKNLFLLDKLKIDLRLDNIDFESLKRVNKTQKEEDLITLLSKGLKINLEVDIKNCEILSQKIGFLYLKAILNVKEDKEIVKKLSNNDLEDIDFKMNLKTTPQFATLIMQLLPSSAFVFAFAKKENDKISLNVEIKKGKFFVNGKEVKSN